MKWMNHALVTGILVYGFSGGKVFFTLAGMAGSLFPDRIEGRPPEEGEKLEPWRRLHRKASHWFVPYAAMAVTALISALTHRAGETVFSLVGSFSLGCLFHIGEDALCGYVPSLHPRRKIGARCCAVGSVSEYIFCFCLAALLVLGMVLL